MPIGPYPTFDACVKANQDKRNPGAFCADLERKIKQQMTDTQMAEEDKELNNTHSVEGIEIFAAGNWTDSQGLERQWTDSDLDKLLKNFNGDSKLNPLPVKVGHTDDQFNARVADELGIPNSLVTGDEGLGAPRLGRISNVRKEGSTLVADFEDVPHAITQMIEAGFYNAVSVEIDMPDDDDPHLSGVAILGAELPAVGTLASLDTASIFSNATKPWVTLSFQDGEPIQIDPEELALEFQDISAKMEELIKGKKGARLLRAFWAEIRGKMSGITGKKFSASQWATIIEEERKGSNIKLPIALVATLSQETAGKMGMAGMDALKIKNFELPDELKATLLASIGEPNDNFFDRCMEFDFGIKGMEKLGFCAWLTKEYTGKWPNLDNGGAEAPTQSQESENPLLDDKFDIQEDNMGEFVLAPEDLPRLYEALGLPDTATIEDVLAAIAAMKGEEMPPAEDGLVPPLGMPMSEEGNPNKDAEIEALKTEIAGQSARIEALTGFNKNLEHERLVITYAKQAETWITLSGTPEERGKELADIHESAGKETAVKVLSSYQQAHDAAMEAGVLKSVGALNRVDDVKPDEFQDKVDEYAKEHSVSFEKALVAMSSMPKYQAEFAAYTKRVNAAVVGGK